MTGFARKARQQWPALALLLACAAIYWPGLGGGFLFDDFVRIVHNASLQQLTGPNGDWLAVALASGSGPLRRPISMLSFGLNVEAFGMSPWAFKAVNLAIHLGCGWLLYLLARRLAPRLLPEDGPPRLAQWAALACLAWWLLHPLNVSTVLYTVQRMTQLAALFTLAGLLCYTVGREHSVRHGRGLVAGIVGLGFFGLLAVFSKENGALIVLLALVIELTCFRFAGDQSTRRSLKAFFLLFGLLPAVAGSVYLLTAGGVLDQHRNGLTFYSHLLSNARVLCDYLAWIYLPLPQWLGFYHDGIVVSQGLLAPPTTLLSIFALVALVGLAWWCRRRCPGVSFGLAWFLVGLSMEQGIIALELVFEHRNYLPMAGLLLGSCCALAQGLRRWPARRVLVLGATCLVALSGVTLARSITWGNPLTLALTQARHHPDSARSQYAAGRAIIVATSLDNGNRRASEARAMPYFERALALNPLSVYPATARIQFGPQGRAVPQAWIKDLSHRLRHAQSGEQINPFFDLLIAASLGKAPLSQAQTTTLFKAAMDNPRWSNSARAMLMNDYGSYLFNIVHDRQGAIAMTVAATRLDPRNAYFVLNLAKIALALGQPQRAKAYLSRAERLDVAHLYTRQLAATRHALQGLPGHREHLKEPQHPNDANGASRQAGREPERQHTESHPRL